MATQNSIFHGQGVYLDHQATTPLDERVLKAMLPFFTKEFGNASSQHGWGSKAARAVHRAREQVARLIGAHPLELVFTSGATESINLALKGTAANDSRNHLVTAATEHPAVLDCCEALENQGYRVEFVRILPDGNVDLQHLRALLTADTLMVSLMFANNEIGVLHPVAEIGAICKEAGVFFHCDASQAAGKESINVSTQNIDLLSLSGHKMYGPKGVGALYVRRKLPRVRLSAQQHGGGHERGYRSGTLNVPGIVGLGEACEIGMAEMDHERTYLAHLRDLFLRGLEGLEYHINGQMTQRLAGNVNLRFPGVGAVDLLEAVPELGLSTASACSRVAREPSRTLRALGLDREAASQSFRVGFGRTNTPEEAVWAAGRIKETASLIKNRPIEEKICEL